MPATVCASNLSRFRGGGYGDIPHYARSTLRNRGNAAHRKDDIGFRLVITGPDS